MTDTAEANGDWTQNTDMPVGEILRQTRLYYRQTLEQVEFALRIRAPQLHALEEGNVDQLPGRVYAIGFVRAYSEYLGLDGDRMVHLFKTQSVGNKDNTELSFPEVTNDNRTPGAPIVVGGLLGTFLLLIVWGLFFAQPTHKIDTIPDIAQNEVEEGITKAPPIGIEPAAGTQSAEVAGPAEPLGPPKPPASILQPEPAPEPLVIRATEASWVEIKNAEGRIVLSQILNPGDEYTVPNEGQGMTLTTGNAGGLEILAHGTPTEPLGRPAQVRRNIALDTPLPSSR